MHQPLTFQEGTKVPSAMSLPRRSQQAVVPVLAHHRKKHPSSHFLGSSDANQALHNIVLCWWVKATNKTHFGAFWVRTTNRMLEEKNVLSKTKWSSKRWYTTTLDKVPTQAVSELGVPDQLCPYAGTCRPASACSLLWTWRHMTPICPFSSEGAW